MGDVEFYQVLGVKRSASADEIKSAYRELVKRYHPDLFATAGEKAVATEKLRQITEAYSILGNAENRRRYDQSFAQQPNPRPRAPGAVRRQRGSPTRRPVDVRGKIAKTWTSPLYFPKKRIGYVLAGAMVLLAVFY